jgi:four helix bundle protein
MIGTIAVSDFREYESWRRARVVVCSMFDFTRSLSRTARYSRLAADINRLSVSVLDNMAKGYEGSGDRSFLLKARTSADRLSRELKRACEMQALTPPAAVRLKRELDAVRRSLREFVK